MSRKSFIVSLIGRPNVGKSSLFNRLMNKSTMAITHDMPGVTRDRHYGHFSIEHPSIDLKGQELPEGVLIDTGGFYPEGVEIDESSPATDHFFNLMTDHAHLAIKESDLVLLICDVREGVLPYDEAIAHYIRTQKKKFLVIANKYDSNSLEDETVQFYTLGLEEDQLFAVSAAHGLGVDSLRQKICELALIDQSEASSAIQRGILPRENVVGKIAIVGAPNAGKSTLLNALVGAERALVSNVAGTTVDPIEAYFDLYFGPDAMKYDPKVHVSKEKLNKPSLEEEVELAIAGDENTPAVETTEETAETNYWRSVQVVDTAGIRKQKAVKELVESQSVFRALRSITECDLVIHLADSTKGVSHQDRRLIDIAIEKGKSVIVCLNKIDLMAEQFPTEKDRKEWILDLRAKIPWLNHCDVICVSAKYKKALKKLKNSIKKTIQVRNRMIPTGELNRAVMELVDRHSITMNKKVGTRFRVKYASMVKSNPPTFLIFTNRSKGIPDNYRRYLVNGLRGHFQLDNTPVHLIFRTTDENKKRDNELMEQSPV